MCLRVSDRRISPVPTNGSKTRSFSLTLAWLAIMNDSPASILVFPMKCLFFTLWERISSRCPSAIWCRGRIKTKKCSVADHLFKCKQTVKCVSPIGQNRCSLDAQGCCWGLCHNLPSSRRCAEGSSGSLCLQTEDTPKPGERVQNVTFCTRTQTFKDAHTPRTCFHMHSSINFHTHTYI